MTTTRSTRFSPATCVHCGRTIIGLYIESTEHGITQAECTSCHRKRLAAEVAKQIEAKRKAVAR